MRRATIIGFTPGTLTVAGVFFLNFGVLTSLLILYLNICLGISNACGRWSSTSKACLRLKPMLRLNLKHCQSAHRSHQLSLICPSALSGLTKCRRRHHTDMMLMGIAAIHKQVKAILLQLGAQQVEIGSGNRTIRGIRDRRQLIQAGMMVVR